MLTIRSVETLDDYWLRLTLSDRTTIEREVSELLRGPVFEHLRTNYAEFRRARVRHATVEWPGDLDLAPETLIWDGPARHDAAEPPPRDSSSTTQRHSLSAEAGPQTGQRA